MFNEGRGGRGRHWQGFGGPRGRGAGRPLEQGDLRWLVLQLVAAQPSHGYEIIKAIEDLFSGHYSPSPGVIYPTLTLLEETGLIEAEALGPKKLYRLTKDGQAEIDANAAKIDDVRSRIDHARSHFGGEPAPELRRAMDNLRAAIQVRLSKGQLSPDAVRTVTAALDRAVSEIEKS